MASLHGRIALITGAGSGIGRSIAERLARDGAAVVINDLYQEQSAMELLDRLLRDGCRAAVIRADIGSAPDVRELVRQTMAAFGGIDILVNNAAIDPTADFFEVTEEEWDRIVNTNVKGAFFCAQACALSMKQQGHGRIVNISSVHGQLTMPRYAVYTSTKGAINALTRQLSIDLAGYGITVNAVAPGATEVEKFVGQPWYDAEAIGKQIPLGRIGQPGDIAAAVAFLASDDAAFITGHILTVDGGSSARLFLSADV
ncbi:MAG: 3-oxoacyl-ACP reductase FabG [Paenibacillaceae bacterium]|nr:3-oxoacyl-ACP reductase FabG [Paenibacillaceae bacterium]